MTRDLRAPSTLAFLVGAGVVAIAYVCLAWQQLRYGIEYDESANLNLVKNFAEGVGYATTGLNYGWLVPFDPGASTGPALLVPGALFWHLSGGTLWFVRIVPLLYFALYLGCLWLIFKPIAGRWAALIAVAAPLCLSVGKADISTVSLVPGRYVGECTAVTFTVLMIVLITRRHAFLAGLAGGLAVLTKFNFALPVVVIVLVWLIGLWVRREGDSLRTLLNLSAGVIAPLAVFEVFRLSQVGFGGYVANVKAYIAWLGGQTAIETEPLLETLGRRLGGLSETMSSLAIILFVGSVAVLVAAAFPRKPAIDAHIRSAPLASSTGYEPVMLLLASGGSILVWWGLISPAKLPRAGMPIIMLVVPVVAVATYLVLHQQFRESEGRQKLIPAGVSILLGGLGVATVVHQGWIAVYNDFGHRLMVEQSAAAELIVRSGTPSIPTEWIWHLGQFQLLTGLPSDTKPGVAGPTVQVFDSIRARTDYAVDDARAFESECGELLYQSQSTLVCR